MSGYIPLNAYNTKTKPYPATIDSFLNWCVALKDARSELGNYLKKRKVLKAFYTLCELLTIFKEVIRDGENFDPNNPGIILADPDLEKALGQRAISVKEIRNVLIHHIQLAEPGPTFRPTLCFSSKERQKTVVGTPVVYLNEIGQTFNGYLFSPDLIPHAGYSSPVTIKLLQATMENGFSIQFANKKGMTICSIKCLTIPLTDHELDCFFELVDKIQSQARLKILSKDKSLDDAVQLPPCNYECPLEILNQPAIPTPKLLTLLQSISGESMKNVFTYQEIFKVLNRYMLEKQEELFMPNSLIALVENDPLGEIFHLRAFHQCQLGELIQRCLTPIQNPLDTPIQKTSDIKKDKLQTPQTAKTELATLLGGFQTKGKCFACKNLTNSRSVFCGSCWGSRKKKVGPSFHPPKIKKKQPTKPKPNQTLKAKDKDGLCKICFQKEAKAGFLHGRTFHLFGCFDCCREIYLNNAFCPLCRGLIEKIILKYEA